MAGQVPTRILMVCAAVGVACGLLLVPVNYAPAALMFTAPLLVLPLSGIWAIPPLLGLGILRRPGAALLTSTIAGLVTVGLTPFGWIGLGIGIAWGIIAEIPFLISRYRLWRGWLFAVAGALIGALTAPLNYTSYGLDQMSLGAQVFGLGIQPVSGAVCGVLAYLLAERLAGAGIAGTARSTARPST